MGDNIKVIKDRIKANSSKDRIKDISSKDRIKANSKDRINNINKINKHRTEIIKEMNSECHQVMTDKRVSHKEINGLRTNNMTQEKCKSKKKSFRNYLII